MIIACPACNTRYVVPDEAIGVEGRTVRCAKCKHNWYQDGPELEEREAPAPAAPTPEPPAEPEPDPEVETGAEQDTSSEPADDQCAAADEVDDPAPEPAPQPSVSHWRTSDQNAAESEGEVADAPPVAPPSYDEPAPQESAPEPEPVVHYADSNAGDHSQFDYEPPFRARRNPLKMWTAAGVVFALLAFGTIIGVNYWGLPDWVPVERPLFAAEEPDLVIEFPGDQQDRRTLPNGTEYFGASGTITNVGRETVDVPSVLIILRDERRRIVYSWEVVPPQPTLAPGETLTIKEAVTDVPRSAQTAEIGWKPI